MCFNHICLIAAAALNDVCLFYAPCVNSVTCLLACLLACLLTYLLTYQLSVTVCYARSYRALQSHRSVRTLLTRLHLQTSELMLKQFTRGLKQVVVKMRTARRWNHSRMMRWTSLAPGLGLCRSLTVNVLI